MLGLAFPLGHPHPVGRSIEVIEGAQVSAGTPIIVLEAMKMEHTVRAPAEGVVASISVATGDQVDSGQVLAVVHGGDQ